MYISKFPFQVFCCSKHNSRDKMLIKEAPNVGAERESLKSLQGCRQERSAFKICSADSAEQILKAVQSLVWFSCFLVLNANTKTYRKEEASS